MGKLVGPAAAHLLLVAAAVSPLPVLGTFTCPEGEVMVCYAADGLAHVANASCVPGFDRVLERAIAPCLENWSDLEGNRVVVSAVLEVGPRVRLLGGEPRTANEGGRTNTTADGATGTEATNSTDTTNATTADVSTTTTTSSGGNNGAGSGGSIDSKFVTCRKCVKDCVSLGTCNDRRRILSTNDGNDDELKETKREANRFLPYGRFESHYDFNKTAHCLDLVMTFQAQPLCPGAKVTNGVFGTCSP